MGLLDIFGIIGKEGRQYLREAAPGGLLNPELDYRGMRKAIEVASMIPMPVGDAASGLLAIDDLRNRNYGSAALNSVGLIPFIPAMGGIIKEIGDKYGVIGRTYDYREPIRKLGGVWSPNNKAWMFDDLEKARQADKMWGGSGLLDTEKAKQIAQLDIEQPRKYLNVPYAEKDKAKKLGAMWDPNARKWYVRGDIPDELTKYAGPPAPKTVNAPSTQPTQLTESDLIKRAAEYKRGVLEGGDGYNPWQEKLDQIRREKLINDPSYWESIANDYKRKASDALLYDADGWLDEAARQKNAEEYLKKAKEALDKANLLRNNMK